MEFQEASLSQRFFAFLIDIAFVIGFSVGLYFLIGDNNFASELKLFFTNFTLSQFIIFLGNISTLKTLLYFICYLLFHMIYFIFIPMIFRGKTFGKMFLNIRIIKFDDTKPGFGHLFIREVLCYFILVIITLGLVLPVSLFLLIVSRGHRSLGDRMSNLLVVKDPYILSHRRHI